MGRRRSGPLWAQPHRLTQLPDRQRRGILLDPRPPPPLIGREEPILTAARINSHGDGPSTTRTIPHKIRAGPVDIGPSIHITAGEMDPQIRPLIPRSATIGGRSVTARVKSLTCHSRYPDSTRRPELRQVGSSLHPVYNGLVKFARRFFLSASSSASSEYPTQTLWVPTASNRPTRQVRFRESRVLAHIWVAVTFFRTR